MCFQSGIKFWGRYVQAFCFLLLLLLQSFQNNMVNFDTNIIVNIFTFIPLFLLLSKAVKVINN